MGLPIPVAGVDSGPDYALNVNACLAKIDSHDHSLGNGVPITPNGMNISLDLPFNNNNATLLRSIRFSSQSPLSGASDLGCLYESGVDLYYNDGNGNQIRITQSGSVSGASGTITGLPSGTASASFSAGTFTFQAATNTPAALDIGSLIVRQTGIASPNGITLQSPNSLAANYVLTFPTALPASTSFSTTDSSGNMGFSSFTPAAFNSAPLTFNVGSQASISQNFLFSQIGKTVTYSGRLSWTQSGGTAGEVTIGMPLAASSSFFGTVSYLTQALGVTTSVQIINSSQTALDLIGSFPNGSCFIYFTVTYFTS